jgi:hypothetical protein
MAIPPTQRARIRLYRENQDVFINTSHHKIRVTDTHSSDSFCEDRQDRLVPAS